MLHSLNGAPPQPDGVSVVRVASVPSSHVYVRHLSPPGHRGDRVLRLPDPVVAGRAEQSPWWPPTMLTAQWVHDHHHEIDVFHVHFGFDARTPDELTELVGALREHDKPLVLTVHDLRNPHHTDPAAHEALLDVLIPAAQGLITLTPGAAAEVGRRWGRWPVVIPHPHVVDLERMTELQAHRAGRRGDGDVSPFRVGLHLKSVRAGMDPTVVLPGLARAVDEIDDAVLQVNGHRELLEPRGIAYDRDMADLLRTFGDRIDVRVHDFFTDDELWEYLASLDASVLAYRFGTHSGWLEACRDLGTAVIAPSCGYYAEQGPVHSYVLDEGAYDEQSLVAAVHQAHRRRATPVTVHDRERQRHQISLDHRQLYDSLIP